MSIPLKMIYRAHVLDGYFSVTYHKDDVQNIAMVEIIFIFKRSLLSSCNSMCRDRISSQ